MTESEHDPESASRDQIISLVKLAQKGDFASLEELLTLLRPRINQAAERFISGKSAQNARFDRSDVTQSTLMDVANDIGNFMGDTDAEFLTWLRRVLERNVTDAVRSMLAQKRSVERENSMDSESNHFQVQSDQPTPSQGLMREEQDSRIGEALDQLPEELRSVLCLKEIDGLKMSEIAQRLEFANERTAYRRYHEALGALQKILGEK